MQINPVRVGTALLLSGLAVVLYAWNVRRPDLDRIELPPGFSIFTVTDAVPDARQLALGDDGTVFAGSMGAGAVYAVRDTDSDGTADSVYTVAEDLRMPSGVAFRDGSLYVAAVSRVLRYDDIERRLHDPPPPVTIRDDLPADRHHGWKFIAFGPDGWLYVPVGAPCNICFSSDERYASILRMRPDGSDLEVYARGVRNSVGFDFDPADGTLWFTDNGRDNLGDDEPPDELNRVSTAGEHFGYPFCHGGVVPDPEYGSARSCDEFTAPRLNLGPHVAAIGMRFYTGTQFPERYRGQIFIAEHGSWNRSTPIGYRVTLVRREGTRAVRYEPFAEGWLRGRSAWGRPADVLVADDGSLLVSDDRQGAIYRIRYNDP